MQTASPRGFSITPAIKREIIQIIDERIREAHVTKEDFSELKAIVKDLGIKVGELADAQKRTEQRVEELAEVQKRSELEIQKLAQGLDENNRNFGGLSRSMGYAFENEAFRLLPNFLRTRYGIDAKEKIVRGEIGGKEINLFARAERNGKEALIVGEAKLRLDERRIKKQVGIFDDLEQKVQAVKQEFPDAEIVKVLITHFATRAFLDKARAREIIVV